MLYLPFLDKLILLLVIGLFIFIVFVHHLRFETWLFIGLPSMWSMGRW